MVLPSLKYNSHQPTTVHIWCSACRLSDTTALALKLSGVLAWPCISAAAVLQPLLTSSTSKATTSFPLASAQVAVCTLSLLLLLTVAAAAGGFLVKLARSAAGAEAVQDFGFRVGLVCAAQAVLNVAQMGLGIAGGQLAATQLGEPCL